VEVTNVIFDETRLAVRLGDFFKNTLSSKSEFHADRYSYSHIALRSDMIFFK